MSVHAVAQEKIRTFGDLLEKRKDTFAKVLPRHMNPDRLIKVAMLAISRQPLLLQCTPMSLIQSMMAAAQLGLEPDGVLGSAYLVPYRNNKTGQYEAQLIPGYRGLIDLARRSGQINRIEAHVVKEKDEFDFSFGLEMRLRHRPHFPDDAGAIIGVYALAELKDGSIQVEVMSKADIDTIKTRSKAKDHGPWVTDYAEMARKTVVRRLIKYLPLSVELANAVELDNRAELGTGSLDLLDAPDIPQEALPEPPKSQADSIKEELTKRRSKKAPEPSQTGQTPPAPTDTPVPAEKGAEKPSAPPRPIAMEQEEYIAKAPEDLVQAGCVALGIDVPICELDYGSAADLVQWIERGHKEAIK